jgi:hypothetical protein
MIMKPHLISAILLILLLSGVARAEDGGLMSIEQLKLI